MEISGLTGVIKFDNEGFRTDLVLNIIELNTRDGLTKIGTWNSTMGINFTRSYQDLYHQIFDNLQNKTFVVTTILVRIIHLNLMQFLIELISITFWILNKSLDYVVCTKSNIIDCN